MRPCTGKCAVVHPRDAPLDDGVAGCRFWSCISVQRKNAAPSRRWQLAGSLAQVYISAAGRISHEFSFDFGSVFDCLEPPFVECGPKKKRRRLCFCTHHHSSPWLTAAGRTYLVVVFCLTSGHKLVSSGHKLVSSGHKLVRRRAPQSHTMPAADLRTGCFNSSVSPRYLYPQLHNCCWLSLCTLVSNQTNVGDTESVCYTAAALFCRRASGRTLPPAWSFGSLNSGSRRNCVGTMAAAHADSPSQESLREEHEADYWQDDNTQATQTLPPNPPVMLVCGVPTANRRNRPPGYWSTFNTCGWI